MTSVPRDVLYRGRRKSEPELLRERAASSIDPHAEWPAELEVTVERPGEEPRPLVHVVHHSPGGYEWGYGGSGPSDLALSILCDFLEEDPQAVRESTRSLFARPTRSFPLHLYLVRSHICRLPRWRWTLTGAELTAWLATDHDAINLETHYPDELAQWEELERLRPVDPDDDPASEERSDP